MLHLTASVYVFEDFSLTMFINDIKGRTVAPF